ncbi:MAG TPA: ABC transporter ATP-binding protein/permease [Halieaceae bacterium]|jgi:ATP-binding cassette subfamily B protein|uniref:ABCB family ABC transporter ATP-binding protein/permease n=1 Tax=Haliea TaxID=475794 RepID=UPI0004199039|nr:MULTISPECIES: ABC transporter ATP-binding protein/permease [Haliea]HBM83038.1 ABC transporter ATP-binding protein/permease [Halieaceae bacterium]MAD64946.1 ABC transporter ATP-binding protein/permease [Haliea sp.]MAY94602.1 ABC transporter ATP-binding protein/permease [Haliea sp.]MBP71607.1 ABC transporter ATP-binding protein/permease [Haliea sp.]HBQ41016.1 ABC transporter ATP-binding protein/permease [Halieaceae bacterium]|tara:strand:- start:8437 stop:10227 length:1791 start_codon:yes stop_codon:yes gene_type:complete
MRPTTDAEPGQVLDWSILPRLWPYLRDHRRRIALAMLCLLLAKGAMLVIPFIMKHMVDGLNLESGVQLAAQVAIGLVAAYGLARFSSVLFAELRDTLFGRVTERAMRSLGLTVFRHVHQLDLSFHLERRTGGLARDIERGTSGVSFLLRFMVFNIVPTLFEIAVVVSVFLFNYGASYAVVTLVSVIAYGWFSFGATEWRTRFVREMNEADSASNTRAVDSLLNFETVKYFGNERFEAERYDEDLARWEQARRRNRLSLFGLNGGQALIIALAQTSIIGLAVLQVRDGQLSLGDFVLISQYMIQLFLPLGFLGFVYREMKGAMANIERLFGLLDVRPALADRPGAPELVVRGGGIRFEQVAFRYQATRSILDVVNFEVPAGKKVAVVGASGAGKSTLVKLLFRFYDPSAGRILIDGQDIAGVTRESLRKAIGIVPQDTVLFNDTLLENLRYGKPDASDAEVAEAVRMAHLDAFIAQLPDGWETRVGERGLKLSGGEKQRVSIARTILKRPPILVFDEATSSLDSRSEQAILTALREIALHHTSLVIAHRLSTVVDADSILVLDQGRIVEQGSHRELLASGGRYAALWAAQQEQQAAQ